MADPTNDGETARDRLTRWRLVLGGGPPAEGLGSGVPGQGITLSEDDQKRDAALEALYDGDRRGGLGGSAPKVSRWLGDIRGYFPTSVVQVMQADAMDRLGLRQLLLEPEMMQSVTPDVSHGHHAGRPRPRDPRALPRDGPPGRPHRHRPARGASAGRGPCRP